MENKTLDRQQEIRNLLERLRIAWEKRPEMELAAIVIETFKKSGKFLPDGSYSISNEDLITAIEKLCEGEK